MILKKFIGAILQCFFSFFPIKQNKIMFETGTGEIKDHLKAIYEYAKENDISDYDFKWAINRGTDVSELGKREIVYKKTLSYYYNLMTSKYWMRTHSVENIVKKRDGQIYIQLWHGPGATKKEGYDKVQK
ncbi:MAG: CDP-glycerol glycerophosphotransferase family protein [Clostridium sp.]